MGSVKIVTDSACDLRVEDARAASIDVVPLSIRFGDEEFVDQRDLTPEEFWAKCASFPGLPETAAPSPGAFEAAYRAAADAGADGVLCVTISGEMSATGQAARVAADAVGADVPVRVVDSRTASLGEGLVALHCARRAAEGDGLDDLAALATDLAGRSRLYGCIDTLENLKRGGRIGGAKALLGTMLSIKPIITVEDGRVEQAAQQRTRGKALTWLVDAVRDLGPLEMLGVMHAQAADLELLLDRLGALFPRDQIVVSDIGAVIGTHVGPRCIGAVVQLEKADAGGR